MPSSLVAEVLGDIESIVAIIAGVIVILGAAAACVWRWRRSRSRKLKEKNERLRMNFRREVQVTLFPLEIDPATAVDLPDHAVASRQVQVTGVVLNLAKEHGGVDVCCPPLTPPAGQTGFSEERCKYCTRVVRPEDYTGKCKTQGCLLTVDMWKVPEAVAFWATGLSPIRG